MRKRHERKPRWPVVLDILCGLLLQVGAAYRNHDLGRGSSQRINYSPRDKSTCRTTQQPSTVYLSPIQSVRNGFQSARDTSHRLDGATGAIPRRVFLDLARGLTQIDQLIGDQQ